MEKRIAPKKEEKCNVGINDYQSKEECHLSTL